MRIVHVAPRLHGTTADIDCAVRGLAAAQAKASSGLVEVVAAARDPEQTQLGDLALRLLPTDRPRWLGCSRALRHHLANRPFELVHAHCPGQRSLHYAYLAAQRHGAPLVVSPAGVFGLGTRERLRFRCAFHRLVTHPQALEQAAGWHATSAEEAGAIRACGFTQPICVAPPGVSVPSTAALADARDWWCVRHPVLAGRPVALCLAVAPGGARLREFIGLWAEAAPADWLLLVVAPGGAAAESAMQAARPHSTDRVLVAPPGERPPHAGARIFLSYWATDTVLTDVAAALAAGLPALVTADAPWSRLDRDRAGWCVPRQEFGPALRRALALGPGGLAELGQTARELARREFDWAHTAELLLAFYRNLRR